MNNKYLLVAVGVVVGLGCGYFLFHPATKALKLGAVTASNALDSQMLVTELTAINLPTSGLVQTTTASILFPVISSTTPAGTTSAPGLAASLGDYIIVSPVTTSTPGVEYTGSVLTPSSTSATFQLEARVASGSANLTPVATTFNITVVPFATFKAAVGL